MHPDLVTILLPLILISLISTQLPGHLCQVDPFHICRQRFQCRNIRHAITYPFWGGNRPAWCGHPGFELDCQADVPLINISSVTYQVLDINFVKRTLRVARQDLLNNTCPTFLHNTTLDQLFDFSSTSNDRNITLYYSCNISLAQTSNRFNCSVNGTESSGFYLTGEPSDLGINLNCENIFVPVNAYAVQKLLNPGVPLRDALASGFSIHWSVNHHVCKVCTSTGGVCGYNVETAMFACICPDASHAFTCKGTYCHEFINEVASISRTSHVNIVNLLGFCYDKNKRALVYEFMANKSLDKFIYQNGSLDKDFQLGWNKLYEIAKGVARGLEYLHRGCNARIVHFDIKPQNILLDEEFCPKISDFGLAKLCRKKQSILTSVFGTRGTIGYIAPEVFCRNFGAVSHKSDVYSYGMMVLEMAGARNIEEARTVLSSENYFPDKIYEQGIVREMEYFDEIISEEEVETVRKMFLIGFWCIQTAPWDRPSMSKVVEMFEGSIESIQIPPKPFLVFSKVTNARIFFIICCGFGNRKF